MNSFISIKQFSQHKRNCLICNSPLELVITNWGTNKFMNNEIVHSFVVNEQLQFSFTYKTFSCTYQSTASIDINTGILTLFNIKDIKTIQYIVSMLNDYYAHVELQCNNSKCNSCYCLTTSPLKFHLPSSEESNIFLYPFNIKEESFYIKDNHNLWIENNFIKNNLSIKIMNSTISSTLNSLNTKKIILPYLIDFNNLSKEKIVSKINTIILYS